MLIYKNEVLFMEKYDFLIVDDNITFAKKLMMLIDNLIEKKIHNYNIHIINEDFENLHLYKDATAIFMDIDLINSNGIRVADNIKKLYPKVSIIFITNNDHMIFDSLTVYPLYFVRKGKLSNDLKLSLIALEKQLDYTITKLFLKINGRNTIIKFNSIIYIEAKLHKVKIVTTDTTYTYSSSFKNFKNLINSFEFIQIQRSYVINMKHINSVETNKLILSNGLDLNIGNKFKDDFFLNILNT